MIRDSPKWWAFLKYNGFKSHVNVTEGLEKSVEKRIGVGKEEAWTSAFNQAYDTFQAKQEKAQTRQLLELERQKIHGRINQWQIITIISTSIQKILLKYGQIPLLLLTFILITACLFLTISRRFHQLLRWERHNIFKTTRVHIMMPCHLFGKRCYRKSQKGSVRYSPALTCQ